ncbi:MAG: 50S ribosomal protein L17 [candidate division Zixibacteria bacterium]|nr:50S ribosomal protein L17 [candidate division Zixibacteria bacterium]
MSRTKSHRKAMLANMAASLFLYHVIKTTDAKAKEVRKLADKLITLAKRGDLHAHRQVYDVIKDRKLVKKLFDEIAPKLKDREGGYTKVLKLGTRRGDGASLSVVKLLVEKPPSEEKKGKKEKGEKEAKPKKEAEAKDAKRKKIKEETKEAQEEAKELEAEEGKEEIQGLEESESKET